MNALTFNPKIVDNFLPNTDCEYIVDYLKHSDKYRRTSDNDFWDNRVIDYHMVDDIYTKQTMEECVHKMQKIIKQEYNLTEDVYPDNMGLVRWFNGMQQQPHCDDMSDNSNEHARFSHRYFGCIIYLNTDYQGGKTYYPEHNFSIDPMVGRLAIHLGDCNHRHGVSEIRGNIRYTIASFWSFGTNHAMKEIEFH